MKNVIKVSAVAAMAIAAPINAIPTTVSATSCPSASAMDGMMSKLDKAHQSMVKAMGCDGQSLVMEMSEQSCKGKNGCKGLNSCKSAENSCAGMGSCKGTSKGPFTDMNQMVDVAKKHMSEKRMDVMEK